jgi:hypothetical protein
LAKSEENLKALYMALDKTLLSRAFRAKFKELLHVLSSDFRVLFFRGGVF